MHTIAQCLNYPNGTPIDSVSGKLTKTYPQKQIPGKYGPRVVQNAEFTDIGGNKIALSVWEHADLKELEGRELLLSSSGSGKNQGIVVSHESYVVKKDGPEKGQTKTKICLSVNKYGVFHNVEMASDRQVQAPKSIDVSDVAKVHFTSDKKPIEGVLAGMAINKACDFLVASGEGPNPRRIYEVASDIIRVSQYIQKGNLAPAKTVGERVEAEKPSEATPDKLDEDHPF